MKIVDPLKLKIQRLLIEGQPFPLNQARQHYGTEEDISTLAKEFETVCEEAGEADFVFVDLTPFDRIGHVRELMTLLNKHTRPRPILLVITEDIVSYIVEEYGSIPIATALYSRNGEFERIVGGSALDEDRVALIQAKLISPELSRLAQMRKDFTDETLTQLLFNASCLDIPSEKDDAQIVRRVGRKYYRRMANNMLVSCYLNLKEIGRDYQALTTLAYEVVLRLNEFFRRDIDALSEFDVLVTSNNTALLLASSVQAVLEKPIIAIDRLGPIPVRQLRSEKLRADLHGKRVIVIEEVMATGNEVDRAIMLLSYIGADVKAIIALYDLEIGTPMLIEYENMISLCTPKKALNYVYRSE